MKRTEKQKNRIIENIFDIINNTQFAEVAKKEMDKDLNNKNITLNGNTITVECEPNQSIQYTITIN